MKKCPNCGSTFGGEIRFCENCGQPLVDYDENVVEPEEVKKSRGFRLVLRRILLFVYDAFLIFIGAIFLVADPVIIGKVGGVLLIGSTIVLSSKINKKLRIFLHVLLIIVGFVLMSYGIEDVNNIPEDTGNTTSDITDVKTVTIPSSIKNLKDDTMKYNFMSVCDEVGFNAQKIKKLTQITDWSNGLRYRFSYSGKEYILYAYETGEIAGITLSDHSGYVYKDKVSFDDSSADIVLNYGAKGEYGQEDDFESEMILRFYVPAGKYEATALVKGSKLYVETIKAKRNSDGYLETEVFSTIDLPNKDDIAVVEVPKGYCILLVHGSSVALRKIK